MGPRGEVLSVVAFLVLLLLSLLAHLRPHGGSSSILGRAGAGQREMLRGLVQSLTGAPDAQAPGTASLVPPEAENPRGFAMGPASEPLSPVSGAFSPAMANVSSTVASDNASAVPSWSEGSKNVDVIIVVFNGDGVHLSNYVLEYATAMAGDAGRVHILTDVDGILAQVEASRGTLPWGRNIFAANVGGSASAIKSEFMQIYKHQSVNPLEYESFCFWRWGVIHRYIQDQEANSTSFSTIFTIDSDVLPTRPFMEWIPEDYRPEFGRSLHLLVFVHGAAIAWRQDDLSAFWLFIQRFYKDSSVEEQKRVTTKWGSRFDCPENGTAAIIPCEEGKFYHISDMHVLAEFYTEDPLQRKTSLLVDYFNATKDNMTAWNQYVCAPMTRSDFLKGSNVTLKLQPGQGNSSREGARYSLSLFTSKSPVALPLCFLHFAGNSKTQLDEFGDFLKQEVDESTFTF